MKLAKQASQPKQDLQVPGRLIPVFNEKPLRRTRPWYLFGAFEIDVNLPIRENAHKVLIIISTTLYFNK